MFGIAEAAILIGSGLDMPIEGVGAIPPPPLGPPDDARRTGPRTARAVARSIKGMRLFVVEDEALVAMLLEDMLADLGCAVVGIAGSVTDALGRIGELAADGAVLDVNIGGEKVFPVADALAARGTPFVFATGYGPGGLAERYPSAPVLTKPYSSEELATALASLRGRKAP